MKNCPYCGQQNPEENQFCNKCGADLLKIPAPVNPEERETDYTRYEKSVLEKGCVEFFLYIHCIFVPLIGLILGLLVSLTPFRNQKELSSKLITCACIAAIVWFMIAFAVGFIVAL
jgi:hypothetical protein